MREYVYYCAIRNQLFVLDEYDHFLTQHTQLFKIADKLVYIGVL
jgi:hypothetical protein